MTAEPNDDADTPALAQRAATGDPESVEALLLRYLPRLRAFVRLRVDNVLRQRESSSDLVQSICREVLQGAGTFTYEGEERFRAWLFKAALNKILERKRSLAAQKRDVAREVAMGPEADYQDLHLALQSPSKMAAAGEFAAQMERAFDELPEDYREVITLARIVGLPHAEVARQMGRGEGAVRMLLSRALVAYVAAMDRVRGQR
ncbi:MAG: sigma-70 family RNA polymerase sigma factor [Planctomycetota bacterium]